MDVEKNDMCSGNALFRSVGSRNGLCCPTGKGIRFIILAICATLFLFSDFVGYSRLASQTSTETSKTDTSAFLRHSNEVSSLFADWLGFTYSSTWPEVVGKISRRLHGLVQDRLKKARRNYARMSRDFLLPRQLSANSSQSPKLLIVTENPGRLGNYMFRAASLVALARRHGYTPVYLQRDKRAHLFAGLNIEVLTKAQALSLAHQTTFPEILEQGAGIFDEDIANFPVKHAPGQSVIIADYLQSFKYFDDIKEDIRAMLTFSEEIMTAALASLERALLNQLEEKNRRKKYGQMPRLVGVHVRRGDMHNAHNVKFGFVEASNGYLVSTMRSVQKRYSADGGTVFVVATDSPDYCRKKMAAFGQVVILEGNAAEVDLAVLSVMDTVIMTVGSFGWWGGYLSGSEDVYYYSRWPKKRSELEKRVRHEDYFPPKWKGKTG